MILTTNSGTCFASTVSTAWGATEAGGAEESGGACWVGSAGLNTFCLSLAFSFWRLSFCSCKNQEIINNRLFLPEKGDNFKQKGVGIIVRCNLENKAYSKSAISYGDIFRQSPDVSAIECYYLQHQVLCKVGEKEMMESRRAQDFLSFSFLSHRTLRCTPLTLATRVLKKT